MSKRNETARVKGGWKQWTQEQAHQIFTVKSHPSGPSIGSRPPLDGDHGSLRASRRPPSGGWSSLSHEDPQYGMLSPSPADACTHHDTPILRSVLMLQISTQQMAEFKRQRRQEFIDAQPGRLRAYHPDAFARAFRDEAEAVVFVERLLVEAVAAGVDDRDNLETLLDTCLAAGWISPAARSEAGVDAMLAHPVASGPEKVTRIVNAAAFASAFGRSLR